ncbi:hypothetical protein ACTFIZ_000792 [Dictyostelium cf. discoideum]
MKRLVIAFIYLYLILYCSSTYLDESKSESKSESESTSSNLDSSSLFSSSSFSSDDDSGFSSDSSINDSDSSLNDYLCQQLGEEFFVQILGNGFESFSGWNDTIGVIYRHGQYDLLDNYEGIGLAEFSKLQYQLSSIPIPFPNFTISQENSKITNLFSSMEFGISFFLYISLIPPGSSSDISETTSSSGNKRKEILSTSNIQTTITDNFQNDDFSFSQYSKLDLKNIEFNKKQQQQQQQQQQQKQQQQELGSSDDGLERDYLEVLIDETSVLNISELYFKIEPYFQTTKVDVSKFLDGKNHTINFKYHWTGYYENRSMELTVEVDYLNFVPIPLKYIEGDIYVSNKGNDYIGNGSITNSFCSIQMAIYSMASGSTIRLLDEEKPLWPSYQGQSYFVDTVGKDINLIGINTKIETLRSVEKGYSFLCNGGICNIQNITFECYYPNDVMVVTTGAQLNIKDSTFKNNPKYASFLQGIIFGTRYSILNFTDSDLYVCQGSCFFGSFDKIIGINIKYYEAASTILYFTNNYGNVYFDNLSIYNVKNSEVLPYIGTFNSTIMHNVYVESQFGDGDDFGALITNGNYLEFTNFSLYQSNVAFELQSIVLIVIDNIRTTLPTNNQKPFITISDNIETIITQCYIDSGSVSVGPYIYVNQSKLFLIDSMVFYQNGVSVINLNSVDNFTITNSLFDRNSRQVLFFSSDTNLNFINLTITNGPNPFLSASKSSANLINVEFLDNINLNTNSLQPMVYFESMDVVHLKNITSINTLNFDLIKFVNCHSVTITESLVINQLLGNIFGIENSHVNISYTNIESSFLASDYPIHCTKSKLQVNDCNFFNTTQYFFIDSSSFNITNCQFENMITVIDQSYYINDSTGRFEDVTIGPTDPHIGLEIKNSIVDHYGCHYFNISSLNNTLGLYTDSIIKFDGCKFSNNAAANLMMTFEGGKTVFNNCIFDSLSSLDTSILKSSNQEFLYFNSSIIRYCQSNGNGVDASQTNALFENSIVVYNYYIEGNLFKMIDSNISFCNITHEYNEANYYVSNSTIFIEFFYSSHNYFPSNLFDINGDSTMTLRESIIDNNDGYTVITCTSSIVFLNDSIFENNSLVDSFAMSINSHVMAHNLTWNDNISSKNGSCINSQYGSLILQDSSFISNSAVAGGVFSIVESNVIIYQCYFANNSASYDGSDFSQNGCGACFYVFDYQSNITVIDSSFFNNNASHRGGVFYLENNFMVVGSDSPYIPQVNITNSKFSKNTADFGPGGVCYSELRAGCVNDISSAFQENVATYGDIYASSISYFGFLPIVGTHPFTPFTIGLSLFDFYNQSMPFLDFLANYTLEIYNLQNNEMVFKTSMDLEYQGLVEVDVTVNYTLYTQFGISATAILEDQTKYYHINTTILLSPCDIGYEIGSNQNCTPCPIGQYGYDGVTCIKCDINEAICPGKSVIYPQSGYWILLEDNKPPDIYPCDPAYCLTRTCREGQGGVLCSVCDQGYSKVKMFCQECDGFNFGILSGMVVFVILFIFIMSTFSVPSASIIFNYLLIVQIVAVFGYNIQYLSIIPLFGLDIDYWPQTCLDPTITYIWKQLIALIGMLFIITPISIRGSWCRDLIIRLFPHLKVFVMEFFDRNLFYSVISFLLCFYTPVTYISLALVSCTKIGDSLYLSLDPSVQCFTPKHLAMFIVACIVIIVVSLGIPIYIFIQIRKKNRYFLKIFFDKYRPYYQWWDLILLLRSILYILVTFIFAFNYMYIKGLAISTLGLLFTFLTWICQPYKSQYKNDMEVYLSLILCLTGIIVNTRSFNSTDIISGVVLSLSGIGALIPIAICIHHISKKIFPTGLQTTNPPTTKIRTKSKDTPKPILSINDEGDDQTDSLLILKNN